LAIPGSIVGGKGIVGPTFVPDFLIDNPEKTRGGLKAACRRLEFEHLLLGHGDPVIASGREELDALVSA
jgi:hypothetical protein